MSVFAWKVYVLRIKGKYTVGYSSATHGRAKQYSGHPVFTETVATHAQAHAMALDLYQIYSIQYPGCVQLLRSIPKVEKHLLRSTQSDIPLEYTYTPDQIRIFPHDHDREVMAPDTYTRQRKDTDQD